MATIQRRALDEAAQEEILRHFAIDPTISLRTEITGIRQAKHAITILLFCEELTENWRITTG